MGEIGARTAPLALLEAVDRDGHVRQAWRVDSWPLAIGRALDNDVVLTDPHVAAHHATIAHADGEAGAPGTITVEVGASKNGLGVGRDRVQSGEAKVIADAGRDLDLHIGRTQLRLRLPGHALPAEQLMAAVVAREQRWLPSAGLALVVLLVILASTWIDTDPDGLTRAAGSVVLMTLFSGAVWCGFWALLSKVFTRQSHFGWHVRVFVIASLVLLAFSMLPPLLAFAFSWPWITDFSFIAVYATVAAMIHFHLLAVEPARARLIRAVTATGFVVGVALVLWFNVQRTGRPGDELYMNHLFVPQLRVARPVSVDKFVDGLAPMQSILDRKAREQSGTDGDSRSGGDDDE
jgi:hypothetical protein